MTGAAAAFDPQTGMLTASRETIGEVARFATGAGAVDEAALDALLGAAGAGTIREPHPRFAQALSALQRPIVGVVLGKTGYGMPGWVGEGMFTMHVYRHGHDDELVSMPADHLVHFLLWLLGVGPRPRAERPAEIRIDGEVLNRAIAVRLGDRPTAGLLPEPLDTVLAERFRDWWMATSRWPPAEGRPAAFAIEAVDTDDALWSIEHRDDGEAVVRPVTPVSTMLALGELLPNQSLVDQDAPRLAVDSTPVGGGPVAFVAEVLGEG